MSGPTCTKWPASTSLLRMRSRLARIASLRQARKKGCEYVHATTWHLLAAPVNVPVAALHGPYDAVAGDGDAAVGGAAAGIRRGRRRRGPDKVVDEGAEGDGLGDGGDAGGHHGGGSGLRGGCRGRVVLLVHPAAAASRGVGVHHQGGWLCRRGEQKNVLKLCFCGRKILAT